MKHIPFLITLFFSTALLAAPGDFSCIVTDDTGHHSEIKHITVPINENTDVLLNDNKTTLRLSNYGVLLFDVLQTSVEGKVQQLASGDFSASGKIYLHQPRLTLLCTYN